MAALPYIKLYVADYMSDTAHLTTLEHGAYLLLIMNYWQRGKPLSALNERLASVARMSNEDWESVRPTLSEFFTERDGCWHHGRIDRDLEAVCALSQKAKKAGQASGSARKKPASDEPEKSSNERSTNVQRTLNHTDTDTDTDTDTEQKGRKKNPLAEGKKKATPRTSRGSRIPPDFTPSLEEAVALGLDHMAARSETLKFRDYFTAQPGHRGVRTDWPATWRNWCRKALEYGGKPGAVGLPLAGPQPDDLDYSPEPGVLPTKREILEKLRKQRELANGGAEHDNQQPGYPEVFQGRNGLHQTSEGNGTGPMCGDHAGNGGMAGVGGLFAEPLRGSAGDLPNGKTRAH